MIKNSIYIMFITALLVNCEKKNLSECSSVDLPCYCGSFVVLDSLETSVIGNNRYYSKDSVSFINDKNGETIELFFEDTSVVFYYHEWDESAIYSLNLGEDYTFKVGLVLNQVEYDCYTDLEIETCFINGIQVTKGNRFFEVFTNQSVK